MGEIIVSVDIGTSKVCVIIGRVNKLNELEVIGKGMSTCTGVKKGIIIDMESTSVSIKNALHQASLMADIDVQSAYVNIIGMHVSVINNKSWINISNDDREITRKDVEKLLYSVRDIEVSEDSQVIDVIPRQYIIDGYDEIVDPVGMVGIRLGVDADIVVGKITSVQNILKSMEKANLRVDGLVIDSFASGEVLLTSDEKEMGVILIDVGGGVTDVSVFMSKRLVFYDSIPVGGDHITSDIAIGLKISNTEAEKIKRQFELALTSLIKNDQEIMVTDVNENKKKYVKVSEVVEIIEARVYEIFSLCSNLLQKSGITVNPDAGIVLIGGGISYVDGSRQLAGEVFEVPVRVASYKANEVPATEYVTAAGMIKYIANTHKGIKVGSRVVEHKLKNTKKKTSLLEKIANFFNKLF